MRLKDKLKAIIKKAFCKHKNTENVYRPAVVIETVCSDCGKVTEKRVEE